MNVPEDTSCHRSPGDSYIGSPVGGLVLSDRCDRIAAL